MNALQTDRWMDELIINYEKGKKLISLHFIDIPNNLPHFTEWVTNRRTGGPTDRHTLLKRY